MIKIISGGQTGADQAGLYAARDCCIETGGYAPFLFMTKDGPNPKLKEFGLVEISGGYKKRTYLNVEKSNCTIRFAYNFNSPGEICTKNAIIEYNKPYFDVDLNYPISSNIINELYYWIISNNFLIINIAGNTQTKSLDTFTPTYNCLFQVFKILNKK